MIRLIFIPVVLMSLVLCCFDSCKSYQLERKLDPESRDFLSIVRHIITSEEHKRFINLPVEERDQFMEDFWKRRDPDPDTEENEFKDIHYARIEKANELFGGSLGYLTDRGMIYVLFGPPDGAYHYRDFISGRGNNYERWFYSFLLDKYYNVEFYFVDRHDAGLYKLVSSVDGPPVFSLIQEAKLYNLKLGKGKRDDKILKYHIRLKTLDKNENNVKLSIKIEVPYENIWFSKTKGKMETTLSLNMEILDASKNKIWEHKQDYFLSFVEKELEELFKVKVNHVIEFTPTISTGTRREERYSLHVNLINRSGGEEKKVLKFNI
ncbi:MAG: GWxTD domain-containing protein [Candidatus Aminicenantes bacterium]|nr:MAG: GWxTD domain-containing protein [Candidatus Aminicenantes bacterium]